jgi:hypothetical protein
MITSKQVFILYHQDITESVGYQTAPKEYQYAIEEGVKVLDHAKVLSLQSGLSQEVVGVWIQRLNGDEELIPCDGVLIATGVTQSDLYKDRQYVYKVGDLDPDFRGSVVKSLHSGRTKAIEIASQKMNISVHPKRPSIGDIQDKFSKWIKKIDFLSDHYVKLTIHAPYLAQKGRPGHLCRFHSAHHVKGIPLSFYRSIDNDIELIIHMVGPATEALKHLILHERVHVMGPVGQPLTFPLNPSLCWIVQGAQIVMALSSIITHSSVTQKIIWLYQDEKELFDLSVLGMSNTISVHIIRVSDIDDVPVNASDYVITTIDPALKKKLPISAHQWFYHKSMQCMMQGICGRCIHKEGDGIVRIMCRGHQYL